MNDDHTDDHKPELLPNGWADYRGQPVPLKDTLWFLAGLLAPFWIPLLFCLITAILPKSGCGIFLKVSLFPALAVVICWPLWTIFSKYRLLGGILVTLLLFPFAFFSVFTLGWLALMTCGG